ncbi:MAG: hypothetical protein AAGH70_00355 [Pseudomonadota bacterium]
MAAALAGAGAIVAAQIAEEEGGVRAIAGLDMRLEFDDGDTEFRTGLDLDVISATRTQRLSFSGDFGIRVPLDDPGAAELRDPRYGIAYLRDTGVSRLTLGAEYGRRDLDGNSAPDDGLPFDEDDLLFINGGTEERTRVTASLETGLIDPIGVELRYSFDERLYSNGADPDLEDTTREELGVALRFDVNRTLRVGTQLSWSVEDQGNGPIPDRDERFSAGFDVTWQALPELEVTGELSYARIDSEALVMGVAVQSDRDGTNLRFGARLDRPNGDLSVDFGRDLNTTGSVTTLDVTRSLALPRSAQLDVTLGAAELPSGSVYGTGAIRYAQDTRLGSLSASFSQTATINGDDEEVLRRIFQSAYAMDLPREARFGVSGQFTDSEIVQGLDPDITSARIAVDYSRPLTEDWSFGAGASWQRTREAGGAESTDNRLFLTLERRFTFRR